MLLNYQPWMFYMHLYAIYMIFETNLLTYSPVPELLFFAYFGVTKKQNIKRSPDGMKALGT